MLTLGMLVIVCKSKDRRMKKFLKVIALGSLMVGSYGLVSAMEGAEAAAPSSAASEWTVVPAKGDWDLAYVKTIKDDYWKLHTYLSDCLNLSVGTDVPKCSEWVEKKSNLGDIVCMLHALNENSKFLVAGNKFKTQIEANNVAALIAKLLTRAALDTVLVEYNFGKPAKVTNAFELLLQKLGYLFPRAEKVKFGTIQVSTVVDAAKKWFDTLADKSFRSPLWVLNVDWYGSLSREIVFSPYDIALAKAYDRRALDVKSEVHLLVTRPLIVAKILGWYGANCQTLDELLTKNPLKDANLMSGIIDELNDLLPDAEMIDSDDDAMES